MPDPTAVSRTTQSQTQTSSPTVTATRTVTQPPKAGYKTTEFWLSVSAAGLSFLLASGVLEGLSQEHPVMVVIGMGVTVLSALGYTVSRTVVKRSNP